MTDVDPYTSPREVLAKPSVSLAPPNRQLWVAYAVAPLVAPVVFAAAVFVLGMMWLQQNPDDTGTPVGVILVPLMAMTVGVVASYGVAGLIGMPIAFQLRKRRKLNGLTIHLAALLWSLLLSVMIGTTVYLGAAADEPALTEVLGASLILFVIMTPCILLSATTFWWLVRRGLQPMPGTTGSTLSL